MNHGDLVHTKNPVMLPSDKQSSAWTSPLSISEWWQTPHQSRFIRTYDAALVASLRSPFVEFWPGSVQATKLRKIFEEHSKNQTASITIGAMDVITSHLMADEGFGELPAGLWLMWRYGLRLGIVL